MKLFIDARMLGNSGIGRYTQNMIEKIDLLGPELDIQPAVFLNSGDEKYLGQLANTSLVYPLAHTRIFGIREQMMLSYYLSALKPDLVHFPNFNVSLAKKYPFVVTIHDLACLKYPGAAANLRARIYTAFMIGFACRQAKMIITDSQYSKLDLMNTLHIPAAKIRVIYLAVDQKYHPVTDPKPQLAKYNLPEKYILYLGSQEKRKNIPALVAAFSQSQSAKEYTLVLAGNETQLRKEIAQAIKDYQVEKRVHFTGSITEKDLPALYSQAGLLAFPSSYEGFGLPILEAMGCGTPVLCSQSTSIPEIAGDAALFIDPADTAGFARAIDTVLNDQSLRQQLREKGFQRTRQFTWESTVKEHIRVYQEIIN